MLWLSSLLEVDIKFGMWLVWRSVMDKWMDGTYCCCVWESRIQRGLVGGGGGGSVDDGKPPALLCHRGCEGEWVGETCRSV